MPVHQLQVMDELDLGDFKHGGVNITGFRLIDPEQWNFKNMQRIWSGLNPSTYKGAGSSKRLRVGRSVVVIIGLF